MSLEEAPVVRVDMVARIGEPRRAVGSTDRARMVCVEMRQDHVADVLGSHSHGAELVVDSTRDLERRPAEATDTRVDEGDAVWVAYQESMDVPCPTRRVVLWECPGKQSPLRVPIHVDVGNLVVER
jgi:hypothetical protein